MKYFTSALVIVALFNSQATTNAIQLSAEFSDDLVKDIALEMSHEVETGEVQAETTEDPPKKDETQDVKKDEKKKEVVVTKEKKTEKKEVSKDAAAKDTKKDVKKAEIKAEKTEKVEEDIPMDAAAIKAYSSVIADAAEDSAP